MVLAGDVIDVSDGMKITAPADVSILKGKEAFTFGKGQMNIFIYRSRV